MMGLFENILSETSIMTWGWTLFHSLWQITLIGLFYWVALRFLKGKNANHRYAAGLVALTAILIISAITFIWVWEKESALMDHELVWQEIPQVNETFIPMDESTSLFTWNMIEPYLPTLVQFWFFGAVLFLLRIASGLAALHRLDKQVHEPLTEQWETWVKDQVQRLGIKKQVLVFSSEHVESPMVYGVFKHTILLPVGLIFRLSTEQMEAILLHELAHIRRYDFLVNFMLSILEAIFFFHPFIWWIHQQIQKERENACDDLVLSSGVSSKSLAIALANVVQFSTKKEPYLAMGAKGGETPTLDRIKRILGFPTRNSKPTTLTTTTMMTTILLACCLMVGASSIQADEVKQEDALVAMISDEVIPELERSIWDSIPDKKALFRYYKNDSLVELEMENGLFKFDPKLIDGISGSVNGLKNLDFEWGDFSNMPVIDLDKFTFKGFDELPQIDLKGFFGDESKDHINSSVSSGSDTVPVVTLDSLIVKGYKVKPGQRTYVINKDSVPTIIFRHYKDSSKTDTIYHLKRGTVIRSRQSIDSDSLRMQLADVHRIIIEKNVAHQEHSAEEAVKRDSLVAHIQKLALRGRVNSDQELESLNGWVQLRQPKMEEFEKKMQEMNAKYEEQIKRLEAEMETLIEKQEQRIRELEKQLEKKRD